LAFGGDVILGRRLNRILHGPPPQPWGPARESMRMADITLVNGEGVISGGGMYFDKGETRPYEYRAHPSAVDMMLDGGVDVVAIGNNHAMDYGPDALLEMLDRLEQADIRAVGGGDDVERAAAPVFVERDGLVVAFVGMNLTATSFIWATDDSPGVHGATVDDADLVERLTAVLQAAREQAHLVFFTPHWGPNQEIEPSGEVRDLAADLIDAGYDGILGHSAHVLQGIELIEGKPVLYDGGNMLWDSTGGDADGRAMHFVLELSRAGVQSVRGVAHELGANEILPPSEAMATEILDLWISRSAALGTEVSPDGTVACDPGAAHWPWRPPTAARVSEAVREAPSRALPDALPPQADTRIAAVWPELGVELVAAHLLAPELASRGAQWVTTWWRRLPDGPAPPADLEIGLGWTGLLDEAAESHLPADWMLPASSWPVGALVRDEQLVRIDQAPLGWVDFDVYLQIGPRGDEQPPATSSQSVDGARIPIGRAMYDSNAPRLLEHTPLP
jgi:poly-gamma-glutamate capsule biosynthesis protein CapA/YwtB (metallophosphatase superfamily)